MKKHREISERRVRVWKLYTSFGGGYGAIRRTAQLLGIPYHHAYEDIKKMRTL